MKRILFALLAAMILFSCSLSLAEEGPEILPYATITDLCPHEHTHTDYYFDAPTYRPLSGRVHTVSGRATVQEICDDCGTVLSSKVERDAETTFPHVFRRDRCVLCGYERKGIPAEELPVERIFLLPVNEETPNQFFCILTGQDLEDAAADILVLRPEDCEAAIALQTEPLWEEMNRTGSTLTAEIESPGAGEVNAFVRLYTAEGVETFPTAEQLSLRIYNDEEGETLPVTYTDPEGEMTEAEAPRVTPEESDPYWSVTWLGDGTYTY